MLKELVKKNRSYRRFDGNYHIDNSIIIELISLTRFCASAANLQPVRYHVSNSPAMNDKIFKTLSWAGYLNDWDGPSESEKPSAYITLLAESTPKYLLCDAGIVCQTMLLGAVEYGLGGCIIGSIDRHRLKSELQFSGNYNIILALALGKPTENVVITDTSDETKFKYFRKNDTHFVPKLVKEKLIVNYFELL